MIFTILGRRYRVVEQGVVTTWDKNGKPYQYNAARVEAVREKDEHIQRKA